MNLSPENSSRPYVISWNLTNRCNLQCEHCYIDAGPESARMLHDHGFEDRSELNTEECKGILDQIGEFAPEAVTILTGGEPLLRPDILDIIEYGAHKDLWMVCGTNGVIITEKLAHTLKEKGLRGMALSLDALTAEAHDGFRGVQGAWKNTVRGAAALSEAGLPFIVQTTVNRDNFMDIEAIADFAYGEMQAKVYNLYFLVSTGRGQFVSDLTPDAYNRVLENLIRLQEKYEGRMMVNAKCAPHYSRILYECGASPHLLKTFASGAGGCPAGTHYMGIRPNGDMTPCPYLPQFGGNLRREKMMDIWNESEIFQGIRDRGSLENRCGECEFAGFCGGCRARAWGETENFMEEDSLCDFEPGRYPIESIGQKFSLEYGMPTSTADGGTVGKSQGAGQAAAVADPKEAGTETSISVSWEEEAKDGLKKIPAFVRGMVIRRIESYCQKAGIAVVTPEVLREIRSRMPAKNIFGRRPSL